MTIIPGRSFRWSGSGSAWQSTLADETTGLADGTDHESVFAKPRRLRELSEQGCWRPVSCGAAESVHRSCVSVFVARATIHVGSQSGGLDGYSSTGCVAA